MIVLGIDPGTANTGLALIDESGAILGAATLTTKSDKELHDFEDLARRGKDIRRQLEAALLSIGYRPDIAVIEAYKDYGGGHLRMARRRYYTPNTIAYIDQALESLGIDVAYQDPSLVKALSGMFSREIGSATTLKNQHTRDAALHALYYFHTSARDPDGE